MGDHASDVGVERDDHDSLDTEAPRSALVDSSAARRILVVEDNHTTRKMFRIALATAGYEVIEAADGRSALEALERGRPDLIIQDLVLPDVDGLELARTIADRLGDARVPIICVSGFLSRLDEARAVKGGFAHVLVKPVDPFQLLDVVATHLALPSASTMDCGHGKLLLLVDDDPLHRKLAQAWFGSAGFTVIVAEDGVEALELARRERPAAIVSDIMMPKLDGFALALAVRRDADLSEIRVILTSAAYVEKADRELAVRVGASAFLSKLDGLEEVASALRAALDEPVPGPSNEPDAVLEGDHGRRALWQLERQVQQNARLTRRSTLQAAQLAVLAGIAEALAKNERADSALADVLAACLDMAGISKGALYLTGSGSTLELAHQIGFSESEVVRVRRAFGLESLVAEIAGDGNVMLVPSPAIDAAVAQRLTAEAGVTSLLLVPVTWGTTVYGTLLLGARAAEVTGEDARAFARILGAQMGQAIGLARTFASLAESERRYRTLTENANDAISMLALDGSIRQVNRRFTELFGCSAEDCIGRRLSSFSAPGRELDVATHLDALRAGTAQRSPPLEMQKTDGSRVVTEFSAAMVEIGDEQFVLSIGRDVTEQVRAQAQLMVSDRMASVGTLAAGVAHEINNPLAAIVVNLEVAVEEARALETEIGCSPRTTELRETLSDARAAADQVRSIVRDLRIFARAEEDTRAAVDPKRVLESSLRMAWNEIRHRARLVKVFGEVLSVDANESRLGQVFLNLIMNAAQAIPEGNADQNEIRVSTSTDPSGRVVVEIRDTGSGMAEETVRNLFVPFFTTKPAGTGTGLGLAICKRIVDGLGGEIAVESKPHVGTTFRVYLRAATSAEIAEAPIPSPPPAVRRGRLLVVDDEAVIGAVVRRIFRRDHEVEVKTSAEEALSCIASGERFDVIFCDLMMPVVTGMEFYDRLACVVEGQAERIVFLTGGAFTSRARTFLERVPNAVIEKPFDIQSLKRLVSERLNQPSIGS